LGKGRWTHVLRARPFSAPAHHPADYVLKVIREEGQDFQRAWQLLRREALVASQMSHPRLAVVLATHLEQAPYYLILPYQEGNTLAALLKQQSARQANVLGRTPTLPLARTIWIVRQLAEGLAALHQRGWLHGDVKPANAIVAARGEVTLLDFGFARKLLTDECQGTSAWWGTLRYAPPESFVSRREITAAADTYSLGLILYELLTNQSPFSGILVDNLPLAHLQRPLPDARNFRRDLPAKLFRLLRQMTAKEPLRRPCDEELIERLVGLEIENLAERV